MAFLEQSPWYQEVAKREQEKGHIQGKAEGLIQGKFGQIGIYIRLCCRQSSKLMI